jgi:hypothetical protein
MIIITTITTTIIIIIIIIIINPEVFLKNIYIKDNNIKVAENE